MNYATKRLHLPTFSPREKRTILNLEKVPGSLESYKNLCIGTTTGNVSQEINKIIGETKVPSPKELNEFFQNLKYEKVDRQLFLDSLKTLLLINDTSGNVDVFFKELFNKYDNWGFKEGFKRVLNFNKTFSELKTENQAYQYAKSLLKSLHGSIVWELWYKEKFTLNCKQKGWTIEFED
jgi:hypothetical protein